MASSIDTVYATLDGTSIDVSGTVPTVYTLAELKDYTDAADLPVRLLLPVSGGSQAASFEFSNFGHSQAAVTWRLTDLMLWSNSALGSGLASVAAQLVEYQKEYLEMLLTTILAPNQPLWVSNVVSTVDEFEWPSESTQFYWGVETVLTITEEI